MTAYRTTKVSADKSMSDIMKLLRARSATGLQWTEEGNDATLRFRWKCASGADLCARFVLNPKISPKRSSRSDHKTLFNTERQRLFRVLFHYLKNMFEAVDGGLITAEQAFLPHLEDSTGQTVSEILIPRLQQLSSGPLTRALVAAPDK